jgi:hypothetical protein
MSYCFVNNSHFISYTPSKNPFYHYCFVFLSVYVIKLCFLWSVCKNEGVHINFIQDFTYTLFLKHILLLYNETRVTSGEYM